MDDESDSQLGKLDALRIPGAERYAVSRSGTVYSATYGRWRKLKGFLHTHGYKQVTITFDNGERKRRFVHRLVAEVFLGPGSAMQEVRHLDGSRTNNHACNLAWGSRRENMQDMVRHGRHVSILHPERVARGDRHGSRTRPERVARGSTNGMATIDEAHARAIRALVDIGMSSSAIARALAVSRDVVKGIARGKTWKQSATL